MTFSVDVRSGKVDLPKRQAGGSLIAGAVGGLASVIGNLASGGAKPASTQEIIEQRDLFDDITADGAVSMYPQPRGTVRANISSVEMREFKGLAETQGVTVNGGLFDGRFNIALPGDGTATSQSKIILTNAQLSEPPNGLLQRVLKLPAPIDVVIGTVQDAGGAMTVPLNFKTKVTGIGTDAIVDVVVQTIGQSIVTALSSAPQKAIQAVIPLPWDQITKAAKEQPIEIDFAPADTGLDPASQAKLAALQKRLRNGEALSIKVHGDLGGADVSTVVRRVNLDPAESIALAAQLRQKKVELIAERQVAAESARAELATGSAGQASATVLQLAALDRELGKTEDALDNLYDLLRPGAEQIVARRVRQACLALAQSRLDTVTQALISAAGTKTQSTISPDPAQVAQTVGDGGGRVTIVIGPAE
jgi:putative transposon-encoded protein